MPKKTILIIGGMGPQASNFAQSLLTERLIRAGKQANIIHANLNIPHFYGTEPKLQLDKQQIELLKSIPADIGFIACNTAHVFFEQIQTLVSCRLEHLIKNANPPKNGVVLCSPTSKQIKIFGNLEYLSNNKNELILKLIQDVNDEAEISSTVLKEITKDISKPLIFGCTEISLQAHKEGLSGTDTLKITIDKIINEI